MNELINARATDLVARLRKDEITPLDLLDALQARIAAVDPKINALPTLCFERARDHVRRLLQRPAAERGLLAGMPVAIKDLTSVAGVRSTSGSRIYADYVPDETDITADRLEAEGAIIYAKSNVPEFGAGANTFNDVFGATLNPWNTALSAAGSSGGAAAALATGMAWLAHGSDVGGSLRNPASFCGIVGMRPTVGRVASTRPYTVDPTLSVEGPMARNVLDMALMFDAMLGEDSRDMLSKPRPAQAFLDAARSGWKPKRVAYSRDLGITPVDPQVADITRAAALRFAEAGVIVEEAHPDFSEAHESFHVLRARDFALKYAHLLDAHPDKFKPESVWNIQEGLKLTARDIVRAEHQRAELARRLDTFLRDYDLLLCPATIVPPFPIGHRYVEECDGHRFANYVEWLAIVYAITLAGAPALSLPCGFTRDNLPVGLQIVAPANGEAKLLAGAKLMEDILGLDVRPIDPRVASG
ncbi:MAG: amidase [Methylobacteriaceae bacterium]|jgi:amidase|nr:amidase [Methylobacteriaceae bacterium]